MSAAVPRGDGDGLAGAAAAEIADLRAATATSAIAGGDAGREFAPAKVNLALHVVGRRADGFHDLDTLVCFPPVGDEVALGEAEAAALHVDGPFAGDVPGDAGNLVLAALAALVAHHPAPHRVSGSVRLRLAKRLPVAAGIGGGSADAAAALRLLARHWGLDLDMATLAGIARPLGADVPMCVASRAARAQGIGDVLTSVPALPHAGIVLANPAVAVSTPAVFRALERADNAPLPPLPAAWRDAGDLAGWLAACRNDLEPAARQVAPAIDTVLAALAALPGARLARLSGSGATCFALFETPAAAERAAALLAHAEPGWWVAASALEG